MPYTPEEVPEDMKAAAEAGDIDPAAGGGAWDQAAAGGLGSVKYFV